MAEVAIERASKVYPDGTRALDSLDLVINDGELMVFVGPSGCGKTTALRMIAGLETITNGTIRIGGTIVNHVEPQDRDIAMVFQNYALYPHMSVYKNLAFPLKIRGVSHSERDSRVRQVGKLLGLEDHFSRRPRQLSGGQRQRVAMGRAIVRQPRVFLMDEPLSNLDAKLRVQMRAEIGSLQRELGITTIYVTHDQIEAMTMGHRVAVMRGGVLQQVASPEELYAWPSNVFVAGFIGSPPMNLFDAILVRAEQGLRVRIGASILDLNTEERDVLEEWVSSAEQRVLVGIRPESFEEVTAEESRVGGRDLSGAVILREALGSDVLLHLRLEGADSLSGDLWRLAHDVEDPAEIEGGTSGRLVVARVNPETQTREGDVAHLRVAKAMRFFDPASGIALRASRRGESERVLAVQDRNDQRQVSPY